MIQIYINQTHTHTYNFVEGKTPNDPDTHKSDTYTHIHTNTVGDQEQGINCSREAL